VNVHEIKSFCSLNENNNILNNIEYLSMYGGQVIIKTNLGFVDITDPLTNMSPNHDINNFATIKNLNKI